MNQQDNTPEYENLQGEPLATDAPIKGPSLKRHMVDLVSLISRQKSRLQNLSILVVINFIAAAIGIVTTVKIANVLGISEFGQLSYILAIGSYVSMIVLFGSDRSLVKELVHQEDRLPQIVLASIVMRMVLLVVSILALVAWQFSGGSLLSMSWSGIVIVSCTALSAITVAPLYDVWGKMQWHSVITLIQKLIYVAIAWIAILMNKLSLAWIAWAVLLSVAIGLLIEFRWALRRLDFSGRMELGKHIRHLVGSGWLFWLASVALLCCTSLNQIILKNAKSNEALGGYAASWRIAAIVILVIGQLARIGKPAAARATMPDVPVSRQIRFLLAYLAVMLGVAGIFSIPSILFPRTIMGLLFTSDYTDAAPILRILAIYVVIWATGVVASQYVVSKGMQKTYFASVVIGGSISVISCFLLIPNLGGRGAALALIAGHGTTMFLYAVATAVSLRQQANNNKLSTEGRTESNTQTIPEYDQ